MDVGAGAFAGPRLQSTFFKSDKSLYIRPVLDQIVPRPHPRVKLGNRPAQYVLVRLIPKGVRGNGEGDALSTRT